MTASPFCVDRSKYFFELLRMFSVNPYLDDLEAPHVLVLGSNTALGRSVIRELDLQKKLYLKVSDITVLDFANKHLQKVLSYVNIDSAIICDTIPRFRHSPTDGGDIGQQDRAFFQKFMKWSRENTVRVLLPTLPYKMTEAKAVVEGDGGFLAEIPYHLDFQTPNDPRNILAHLIAECHVANRSVIDASSTDIISSITSKEISQFLVTKLSSPEATLAKASKPFGSLEATEIPLSAFVNAMSSIQNCQISYRREKINQNQNEINGKFNKDVVFKLLDEFEKQIDFTPKDPFMSIVMVGRHDGFSKGFEVRAQNCLDAISNNSLKVPLANYELVFVDYATPSDKTKLSQTLTLGPGLNRKVRFIEVPVKSHVKLQKSLNSSLSFFEYVAKNIGTRRAKGEFILTTNPDDLISPDFFDAIEREQFMDGVLYRTNRWSGYEDTANKVTVEQLANSLASPWTVSSLPVAARCPAEINGATWFTQLSTITGDSWPCGAGDFLLVSKQMWEAVKGFHEYPGNANVDAAFLGKLMKFIPGYVRFIMRAPIIHQFHPRQNIFRPSMKDHEEKMSEYGCMGECSALGKFQDTDNWGLGDEVFPEVLL